VKIYGRFFCERASRPIKGTKEFLTAEEWEYAAPAKSLFLKTTTGGTNARVKFSALRTLKFN
jgi:hypothetical protein